jgi:oligopeptide/dipeptide ABC transporter ATP-binding protein
MTAAAAAARADGRPPPDTEPQAILSVRNLSTRFETHGGSFLAIEGVSFDLQKGRTLAIVGESGCGKSVTAQSIMRLLPKRIARIESGEVLYDGVDLMMLPEERMRGVRSRHVAMVFQEPMTALNPVQKIGSQIVEAIREHLPLSRKQAWERAVEGLRQVGIPSPAERALQYPHEMSGGMRQRVVLAIALACDPSVIVADEPTTALDVTIQAQILELLKRLQRERSLALMIITHDLGVVAEVADDVAVMYAGQIIEKAGLRAIFEDPQHPYTIGLLSSIPEFASKDGRLSSIEGMVPNLAALPSGCRFSTRCPYADDRCRAEEPPEADLGDGHVSRCWKAPFA